MRFGYASTLAISLCAIVSSLHATLPRRAAPAPYDVSYFYVGGAYTQGKEAVLDGAMYVERWQPRTVRHRYPIVLFHGAGMTGSNWTGTPDGRPGWAQFFVGKGYTVYIVDQPARGRSSSNPASGDAFIRFPVQTIERRFTASARFNMWPQAKLHTQWPGSGEGKGLAGDPVFDQFYASTTTYLKDSAETQRRTKAAGVALLKRIGPAILLTHSQAGAFGWLIADEQPQLVKAIVAIEPLGPPFASNTGEASARPWGATDIAMTYSPAVTNSSELQLTRETAPQASGLVPCVRQVDPPRKLPRLAKIPIIILTGEASYHASYDHCTADFLKQAGADTRFIRLADVGIHGNGHMMMLEKNSDVIAAYIARLIQPLAQTASGRRP